MTLENKTRNRSSMDRREFLKMFKTRILPVAGMVALGIASPFKLYSEEDIGVNTNNFSKEEFPDNLKMMEGIIAYVLDNGKKIFREEAEYLEYNWGGPLNKIPYFFKIFRHINKEGVLQPVNNVFFSKETDKYTQEIIDIARENSNPDGIFNKDELYRIIRKDGRTTYRYVSPNRVVCTTNNGSNIIFDNEDATKEINNIQEKITKILKEIYSITVMKKD